MLRIKRVEDTSSEPIPPPTLKSLKIENDQLRQQVEKLAEENVALLKRLGSLHSPKPSPR